MNAREKRDKEDKKKYINIKVKPDTYSELIKTQALMQFYGERKFSMDDVIKALIDGYPKKKFGLIEDEENEGVSVSS